MSSEDKIKEIFSVVLDLAEDVNVLKVRKLNAPQWDSLAHASIIAAIESEFDISIDPHDYERISSFESAHLLIEEKLK